MFQGCSCFQKEWIQLSPESVSFNLIGTYGDKKSIKKVVNYMKCNPGKEVKTLFAKFRFMQN